jgi:UDP-2-acetamido-2,6-beta-L-arabino-hexul-4-ose reductase
VDWSKLEIKEIKVREDERGWLAEVLKSNFVAPHKFGQCLVTAANPGFVKGNHYHQRKNEWFCIISGQAVLGIVDPKTGERKEVEMGPGNMVTVKVPAGFAHALKNVGNELAMALVFVDEVFNPDDPDTYHYEVFISS